MGDRLHNATIFVSLLALMLLGMALHAGGCASRRPAPDTPAVGEALTRVQIHVETAQQHVDRVIPRVAAPDRAELQSATQSLGSGLDDLFIAQQLNRQKDKLLAQQSDQIIKLQTQLTEERAQWFGDKLHRYAAWITGIGLASWLGYELLAGWLGGGPLLKFFTGAGGVLVKLAGSIGIKLGRK